MFTRKKPSLKVNEPSLITHCVIKGIEVNWDGKGSEAVLVVARSLYNLTELFKSQNITMEAPAIQIGNSGEPKEKEQSGEESNA